MTGFPFTDPLGNWQPGVTLTTTDGATFTGTATFPQGAQLQYKAIAVKNGAVVWERQQLGNRSAVVAAQPTSTIDLTWQD